MTSLPFQQTAVPAPASTAVAVLTAQVEALELRIATDVNEASILKSKALAYGPISGLKPAERAEQQSLGDQSRALSVTIVTNQAKLERLRTALARVTDAEAQAGQPGILVAPPFSGAPPIDRNAAMIGIAITVLVLAPLAIAYAWRLIRRSGPSVSSREWIESNERMRRVEQSVESIAIEIERISEHQRFITHAMTEPLTPIPARRERVQLEHPTPV